MLTVVGELCPVGKEPTTCWNPTTFSCVWFLTWSADLYTEGYADLDMHPAT
jgi:hypothetical protein